MPVRVLADGERQMAADLWRYCFLDDRAFIDWYFRRRAGDVLAMLDGAELAAQIVCSVLPVDMRGVPRQAMMLSGVATAPAWRRQGHMAKLISECFSYLRDRGFCAAALYPFDYDYYQRFGFARCGEVATARAGISLLPAPKPRGRIVPLHGGEADVAMLVRAYELCFSHCSGHVLRDREAFVVRLEEHALDDGYAAVYTRDGREEGYILYSMQDKTFCVGEIGAASHQAREDLLGFIAGHSSTAETVEFTCALEDPLWRLLSDPRGVVSAEPYDMMRIVDIGGAMSGLPVGGDGGDGDDRFSPGQGRQAAGDRSDSRIGAVTLRVLDPQAPWNDGIWSFSASGGLLAAEKLPAVTQAVSAGQAPPTKPALAAEYAQTAGQTPDMPTLTIGELTAWAFGCAGGADLIRSGAALTEDTARAMDALLPKKPFFIYEMY